MTKKLIVIGADWCNGCKALKTQLVVKNVEFEYVDADEQMEYCQTNGVRSLPTSFIIEDNEIVKTVIGNKASEIIGGLE